MNNTQEKHSCIAQENPFEGGFSLLELVASIGILAIVMSSLLQVMLGHIRHNYENEVRSEAMLLAQKTLDEIRFQDPGLLPDSGSLDPIEHTVGHRSYNVTTFFCLEDSFCNAPTIRHITVHVEHNGRLAYQTETVYARMR